jgi:DNA ligase (NAD+)
MDCGVDERMARFSELGEVDADQLLDELSDQYYNPRDGVAPIPDAVFDDLVDQYESKFGRRVKVGAPVPIGTQNKRTLQKPMFSLNKVKTESALNLWKAKNPGPYVISDKVDGVSFQEHEIQLSTRGDGQVGTNIDHLLPHLLVPGDVGMAFIRGELVMPNSVFNERYAHEMANSRNMTAGLINSKHPDVEAVRKLKCLAYEYDDGESELMQPQSEQFNSLHSYGFDTPFFDRKEDVTIEYLRQLLTDRKANADYEIDGLVIVCDRDHERELDGNPKHAIAFKMDGVSAETTVLGVEWNVSKHGMFKPRVNFDPVQLDGVEISWASGFNARFILDNKIGPGSRVSIIRSGAVIPYINEVLEPAPDGAQMPTDPYQWLKRKKMRLVSEGRSKVSEDAVIEQHDGEDYYVWYEVSDADIETTGETEEQVVQKLVSFFSKVEAKHLGEATIRKLFQAGHKTIRAILSLSAEDIAKLDGFQLKGATRIVEAIRGAITNAPLSRIAAASGVLSAGFGERRFQAVLNKFPDILEMDLPLSEMCELLHTAGLQSTATAFAMNLPALKRFLLEHPEITLRDPTAPRSAGYVPSPAPAGSAPSESASSSSSVATTPVAKVKSSKESLQGKSILFSGFRDRDLEEEIKSRGGLVKTSMSGKVNMLVVKVINTGRGKEAKALEMGIEVVGLDDFKKRFC